VGWIIAAFFVVLFRRTISQDVNRIDTFGLNSDRVRAPALCSPCRGLDTLVNQRLAGEAPRPEATQPALSRVFGNGHSRFLERW
jgi:hypothetical protein